MFLKVINAFDDHTAVFAQFVWFYDNLCSMQDGYANMKNNQPKCICHRIINGHKQKYNFLQTYCAGFVYAIATQKITVTLMLQQ